MFLLFTGLLLSVHALMTAGNQMSSDQSANCSTSHGNDEVPCKRLQLMVVLPLHVRTFRDRSKG